MFFLDVTPWDAEDFAKARVVEDGRDHFEPRRPDLLTVATIGYGGQLSLPPHKEGGNLELGAELDFETLKPVWFSAIGRVIDAHPSPEPAGELRIGYDFEWARWDEKERPKPAGEWIRFRPFMGLRAFKFAAEDFPTLMHTVVATEVGGDLLMRTTSTRWFLDLRRIHAAAALDPHTGHPWVEFESAAGVAVGHTVSAAFLGFRVMGSVDTTFFSVFLGADYEL